jgi:phospholipase/carboxylesterase
MERIQSTASRVSRNRVRRIFDRQMGCREGDAPPGGRSVFVPLHYEPGYAYPLLVWLHGQGESESILPDVMARVSLRNYVGVAPQGTVVVKSGTSCAAYGWSEEDDHLMWAEQRVDSAIEAADRRLHIHRDRIFLAGRGKGGTMALRLALADPGRFAGAASFGGPFPQGSCPLARFVEARHLALLVAYAADGTDVTSQRQDRDLYLLHTAGLNVSTWKLPGEGFLLSKMPAELNRWMMQRVCAAGRRVA